MSFEAQDKTVGGATGAERSPWSLAGLKPAATWTRLKLLDVMTCVTSCVRTSVTFCPPGFAGRAGLGPPFPRQHQCSRASLLAIDLPHIHVPGAYQQESPHFLHANVSSGQCFTHEPVRAFPVQRALRVQLSHHAPRRIFPLPRLGLIAPRTHAITFYRSLHLQRFVRPLLVVDLPKFFQRPRPLRQPLGFPAIADGLVQSAMKSLHLPLRLRMMHPPIVQPNPLLDQSHRQPRQPISVLGAPPHTAAVHQHRFRHAVAFDSFFLTKPRRFKIRLIVITVSGWPSSRSKTSSFFAPQPRSCRRATTRSSLRGSVCEGLCSGRRLRSTTAVTLPACSKRRRQR